MQIVRPTNLSRRPHGSWERERHEHILAPPERVWKALTDATELECWWCDEASVELAVGGRLEFRGPTVFRPGGDPPSEYEDDFEILELDAPWRLAFRWRIADVPTTVRFDLEAHLEQTHLSVLQSAERPPTWRAAADEPDWWWLALPALRSYVDENRSGPRLDYETLQRERQLRFEIDMTTFPWIIWSKLTDPEQLRRWWGKSPRVVLEPGGVFRLDEHEQGAHEVIEIDDGARLVHDWRWTSEETSRVEWTITETDEDTRVVVIDDSPPESDAELTRRAIYWTSTLLLLAQISEKGTSPREHRGPWSSPPGF